MGHEGSIQMWKTDSWTPDGLVLAGSLRDAHGLILNGAGTRLLAWGRNGSMELWDLTTRTKQTIDAFQWSDHERVSVAFDRDGSLIAVGREGGTLSIWDVHARALHRAPADLGDGAIVGVHFDANRRLLAVQKTYATDRYMTDGYMKEVLRILHLESSDGSAAHGARHHETRSLRCLPIRRELQSKWNAFCDRG